MAYCKAIGIDLGTTYCCVAVCKDGKAEVIANDQGHRTTPSYVWFSEDDRYIGEEAKQGSEKHPMQVVYGIKRLMGRKFNDLEVQLDIKNWPFEVIPENNIPKVQVEYKKEVKNFTAEEISAMFLAKMKKAAEDFLEREVTEAVITVPAYFNDTQRNATITAGRIAGLNVLSIINEPTSAALAYANQRMLGASRTILIFDFGGGTLDVSIIAGNKGIVQVKAVAGDNHLGGEDIDQNLLMHAVQECLRKYNTDLDTNERAKLKSSCEKAKQSLSTLNTTEINLHGLTNGKVPNMTITRARFDELNEELFKKTMEPVHKALADANLQPEDIDRVILVGGSTRIPKIQEMLQDIFKKEKIGHGINPDEAVACGAAVKAAKLTNIPSIEISRLVLSDVIPLSLGVEVKGGIMSKIISRNSPIPFQKSKCYVTTKDNQKRIRLKVLEGERLMSADNNLLGDFVLHDLPKARKGVITARVTFAVDNNGVLTVSAVEEQTGKATKYTVTSNQQRISEEDITRMIKEAEQFKLEDENKRKTALVKNELEDNIYKIQKALEGNLKTRISPTDIRTMFLLCDDTSKWIAEDPKAGISDLNEKKEFIQNIWSSILKKTSSNK